MDGRAEAGRGLWRVLLAAAALALAACQGGAPARGPAMAALGGAGGGDQDGSGLGGTGHRGGIGGTGLRAEGGLGGTGIVGTVTAFGSIVVQGRHIGLAPALEVSEEARPASPADLRVGQVVAALAVERRAGRLEAIRVRVRYAVEGPVAAVGHAAGGTWLTVAGQHVQLAPAARVEGGSLRPGAWARVSGLRRADGTVRATFVRLDPAPPPGGRVAVRGVPRRDGQGLRIGALPLEDPQGRLRDGAPVRVRGTMSLGRLHVAEVQPDRFAPGPAHRLALEAYVQESLPERRILRVGGLPLRIGPETRIVGGDLGSLAPDRLVRVEVPAPKAPIPEEAPEALRIVVLDEHVEPLSLPLPPGGMGLSGHGPDGGAGDMAEMKMEGPEGPGAEAPAGAEPPEPPEMEAGEAAEMPETEPPEPEAPGEAEPPEMEIGETAEMPETEPPEPEIPGEAEPPEMESPEPGPTMEMPESPGREG